MRDALHHPADPGCSRWPFKGQCNMAIDAKLQRQQIVIYDIIR
jgi:hypothetical protein